MSLLRLRQILFVLFVSALVLVHGQDEETKEGEIFTFQESSLNWVVLKSSNGIKFSARNAHATCIFRDAASGLDRIWVTGGKTDLYKMYNTLYSYRKADVWWSLDGADWVQEIELKGDFFAQNADALPNWEMAPWLTRFGHTLDSIDTDGDGVDDAMIQLGGFAPQPFNDVWITRDGITWSYSGTAEWSPRGWHSTNKFGGKLYLMGGSPLNNEVWVLDSVTKIDRREPSTRAPYLTYTHSVAWTYLGNADWSPRAGMNVFSQMYYRPEMNETLANSTERMVFTGGFGGYLEGTDGYDGYRSRGDVWDTYDGINWVRLTADGFPPRSWHTTQVLHRVGDNTLDYADNAAAEPYFKPPRMVMLGGGYIGGSTFNTKIIINVIGQTDLLFSWDGIEWTRVNYEQGNGVRQYDTFVQYFSSQEWTNTIVDSKVNYLGMWGMTSVFLNHQFIVIGGDKTGAGPLQSETYLAMHGIICDIEGNICNGHGSCKPESTDGCLCSDGCTGIYCDECPEDLAEA